LLSGRRNCLCACHIPKAITTAPAKPNQVMAASVSGLFHFRQANVAYWPIASFVAMKHAVAI
jgi:hypothetical protein